jgi:hypothetical protein
MLRCATHLGRWAVDATRRVQATRRECSVKITHRYPHIASARPRRGVHRFRTADARVIREAFPADPPSRIIHNYLWPDPPGIRPEAHRSGARREPSSLPLTRSLLSCTDGRAGTSPPGARSGSFARRDALQGRPPQARAGDSGTRTSARITAPPRATAAPSAPVAHRPTVARSGSDRGLGALREGVRGDRRSRAWGWAPRRGPAPRPRPEQGQGSVGPPATRVAHGPA